MYSILIVDDDPAARALARIFDRRGWSVESATSVAEALQKLDPPPDCVVLDLMLPDGDGETVLRAIRARGLPTRVVIVTATADLARVAALGPVTVLLKPLAAEAVLEEAGRFAEAAATALPEAPAHGPEYCVVGEMLCEVRTWTDEDWAALPAARRPVAYERVPCLGWVGAVPAGRN